MKLKCGAIISKPFHVIATPDENGYTVTIPENLNVSARCADAADIVPAATAAKEQDEQNRHEKTAVCPKCGKTYTGYPAMSRAGLIKKEPIAAKWIHPYIGAYEFINGKIRWCLWLVNASPKELRLCPTVMARVESVRQFRLNSVAAGTRKLAETPAVFCQIA